MSGTKKILTKLLVAFADALDSMDDREFDLLINGKARLRVVEPNRTTRALPLEDSCLDGTISDMAKRLNAAESRESAANLLASIDQPQKKNFLLLLAKSCGVRVESKDSIARIEQRLIENVVGSRLDSEAIKNVAF